MSDHLKSNSSLSRSRVRSDFYWFVGFQFIFSLALAWGAWHFYPKIAYANGGTLLQYARYVYTALALGLASTLATFAYDALRGNGLLVSRSCNFLGSAIVIGYTVFIATHAIQYEDEHIDVVAIVTLMCGVLSAVASYSELRQEPRTSYEYALRWRLLLCADTPLIVGTIAVLVIRYAAYENVAPGYFEWFTRNVWNDVTRSNWPVMYESVRNAHLAMRLNFWNGFSTGAVAIQLVAFQVVGIMLRLEQLRGSDR